MAAPAPAAITLARLMTEEQLGEKVRAACNDLGWRFLWCRRLQHSSKGILDLMLIPVAHLDRRHVLHREIKGYQQASGKLGPTSREQSDTIASLLAAGQDAAIWTPDDWYSDRILEELR